MATTFIAARKLASSPLLKRLINVTSLRPVAAAASSTVRFFTIDIQASDAKDDERGVDVRRRPERGVFRRSDPFTGLFSEPFDPLSPSTSLNQLFNIMDNFFDTPFGGFRPIAGLSPIIRRNWNVGEDDKALYLRMDMPGIDKDKVKIRVDQETLIIQGEGEKESEEDDESVRRRYSSRLSLPANLYKVDEIKAEMKNGVLKVVVPKVEEEEKRDIKEITVE